MPRWGAYLIQNGNGPVKVVESTTVEEAAVWANRCCTVPATPPRTPIARSQRNYDHQELCTPDAAQEDDAPLIVIDDPTVNLALQL